MGKRDAEDGWGVIEIYSSPEPRPTRDPRLTQPSLLCSHAKASTEDCGRASTEWVRFGYSVLEMAFQSSRQFIW